MTETKIEKKKLVISTEIYIAVYKREVEHIQRELTMIEECFAKQIEDNPVPDGY